MWELKDTTNPCERVILFIKNFQLSSNELRAANQEGIDLYLLNEQNMNIKDYTDGGRLSEEDAYKKYVEENFGANKKNSEEVVEEDC